MNEDGRIAGKLADFFGGTEEHRIELLAPGGQRIHEMNCEDNPKCSKLDQAEKTKLDLVVCICTGVWLIFDASDGATALEYNRRIERAVGSNRKGSPYEDAAVYIMQRKVLPRQERGAATIEGLTAADCNGMDPVKFLMGGSATAKVMIREAVARYCAETGMGSAADSGN